MVRQTYVSTLTALETFFGDRPTSEQIQGLSTHDIERLAQHVNESSSTTELASPPQDALYPGSWVAGNWHEPVGQYDLNQRLLYHRVLVTHDPIADFFGIQNRWLYEYRDIRAANGSMAISGGPNLWNRNLLYSSIKDSSEQVRHYLARTIPYIFELSPLLNAGVILPRPQWKVLRDRYHQIGTSVRHDVANDSMVIGAPEIAEKLGPLPLWDNLLGLHASLNQAVHKSDQRWEWQYEFAELARQLAFADQYSTVYVPQSSAELQLLRLKLGQLTAEQDTAPRPETLAEIARFALPNLKLDAETAVDIRQNESAFDEWRNRIRSIDRDSRGDSHSQLRQRIQDELTPVRNSIESVSLGSAMRKSVEEDGMMAVLSTIGSGSAALAWGTNPGQALASGVSTGVLVWLWRMFRRPRLEGESLIFNSLQRTS